ncbi:MAG TPA: glycoside hydrolase family 97 protein [Gemmatimonadota bacterium]|nr:glycoside hydrolase family 97 protein [Gemmatimonadota bacterium]
MRPGALGLACLLTVMMLGDRLIGGSVADRHELASPDGELVVTISTGDPLTYSFALRGRPVITASPVSLRLGDGKRIGPGSSVADVQRRSVDEVIEPVVAEKFSRIRDNYNELSLDFDDGWGLDVRAYDDGVAYRFRTAGPGPLTVAAEDFTVRFAEDPVVWLHAEESFLTHSERLYRQLRLKDVPADTFASLPALAAFDDGLKLAITEADLQDYPGLYVTGTSGNALRGIFPAYPLEEEQVRDRTVQVTRRAEYIARTSGTRTFPWRVFVVAEDDGDLIESTMVYRLAPPLRIEDPSWIRPGKVAWDWWNALNIYGVDFQAGLNTETYLYFIDFAADAGIEYVILDEGWSDPADLWKLNADIDLDALLEHARERGVGIIPWVVWKTLDDRFEEAMDRFADWNVAGLKVDFMQRDDQPMVNYYWKVAEAAAGRRLLIDFHGAYKPTGLRRAYPNVLTREGVRGLEWSKWSEYPTPQHNVTLPFLRMLAGPMDYTPGAMLNAQQSQFHPVFDRPMSMGTRVHQLAMYVVFESPLQMLADSPSNYLREQECLEFIVAVPTTWHETRALAASVGEYVAVARRHGESWYVGAMTDWTARELVLDLSFLGEGTWSMVAFVDGANAGRAASDYRRIKGAVNAGDRLTVKLAPGGGWAARFQPAD